MDFNTLNPAASDEAAADAQQLVAACKQSFANIIKARSSQYVRAATLLPTFRPLVQLLAAAWPDSYVTNMMAVRAHTVGAPGGIHL